MGRVAVASETIRAALRDPTYPGFAGATSVRTDDPARTLRRIRPMTAEAGITRLADITRLDWIGIPVVQAIRPMSRNISVSLGKGLTLQQARLSAVMEALETFHAETLPCGAVEATVSEIGPTLGYAPFALELTRSPQGRIAAGVSYDPAMLPVGGPPLLGPDTRIGWVPATGLADGRASFVPHDLCCLDFTLRDRLTPAFVTASSNGLASGSSMADALVHGLCEVIERDSHWRVPDGWRDPHRIVDLTRLPAGPLHNRIRAIAQADAHIVIADVTGPTDVPCYQTRLVAPGAPAFVGMGCHPDPMVALARSLCEAAQARLAYVAGSRDDLPLDLYAQPERSAPPQLPGRLVVRPAPRATTWSETIADLVGRIARVAGAAPLAVDLTRREFRLPVVRVVAPGLRFRSPRP
jgi:ribosomal protein S12 methylthiotransferase accessory factor